MDFSSILKLMPSRSANGEENRPGEVNPRPSDTADKFRDCLANILIPDDCCVSRARYPLQSDRVFA